MARHFSFDEWIAGPGAGTEVPEEKEPAGLPDTSHGQRPPYPHEKQPKESPSKPDTPASLLASLSPEFKNFLNPFECWVYEIFLGWISLRRIETLEAQFLSLAEECRRRGCPRDSALSFWKKLWADAHRHRAKREDPEDARPAPAEQVTMWERESARHPEAFAAGED